MQNSASLPPLLTFLQQNAAGVITSIVATAMVGVAIVLHKRLSAAFGIAEVEIKAGEGGTQKPALRWDPMPGQKAVLELLSWRVRLAPLIGQDEKREDLLKWAKDKGGGRVQIRVLTGPGGAGKTRLAAEIADALKRTWSWRDAGFLFTREHPKFQCPALLIVDYPEDRRAFILDMLEKLARPDIEFKRPVRVLLLTRDPQQRWVNDFKEKGISHLVDYQELPVPRLSVVDAMALHTKSLDRLNKHFGVQVPTVEPDEFAKWFAKDPSLHNLPLFITAAAIHALEPADQGQNQSPQNTMRLTGKDIVDALATRELSRLNSIALEQKDGRLGFGESSVGRLTALAAIRGGFGVTDLKKFADSKKDLDLDIPDPAHIVDAVKNFPWWTKDGWEAPQPHIIAAALTFRVLKERSDMGSKWLWAAIEGKGPEIIERLARLVYDVGIIYGADDHNQFVTWLGDMVDSPARAEAVSFFGYEKVPSNLAPLSIAVTKQLLKGASGDTRAGYLNNLSICRSVIGDHAGALKAIQEAVGIYRELAAEQRSAFEPGLATSLNTLSACLSKIGEREKATKAIQESVDIYRQLAAKQPEAFKRELANSLNTLSLCLRDIGEPERALAAIQESVDIFRELAAQLAAFESDLARGLNTLSMCLSKIGEPARALEASKESVDIYRQLAEARPAAFKSELANSLNTLSNCLNNIGEPARAVVAIQESVDIYRELAAAQPAAFEPGLANSLNTLSNCLNNIGEPARAVEAIQESVDIYRRLAAAQPAAFEPGLANSLNTLSNCLSVIGGPAGALKANQEAVDIYRELAAAQPAPFEPGLANSLNTLSNCLNNIGEPARAVEASKESVDIYRGLAAAQREAFEPGLARGLYNLSNCLRDIGESAGAIKASQESVDIYRGLAAAQPEAFGPGLVLCLNNLSDRLREISDHAGAIKAIQESVDICRQLAATQPEAFDLELARALNNLSNRLREIGDHAGAIKAIQEAVDIFRELAEAQPEAFGPVLVLCLNNLSDRLSDIDDHAGALEARNKADAIKRGLET